MRHFTLHILKQSPFASRTMKKTPIYFAYLLLGVTASSSCQHSSTARTPSGNPAFPDSLIQTLQFDTARTREVVTHLSLNGSISADQDQVIPLYPMVSGVLRNVHVMLGDYVHKGELLAEIQSPEMSTLSSDLRTARANLAEAETQLNAEKQMFDNGLATKQDLAAAEAVTQKAQADLGRTLQILRINGGNTNGLYEVRSPINGFVIDKEASDNTIVRPDNSSSLFTISNLQHIWVLANVYESNIPEIHLGDSVSVTTLAYPDTHYGGKIDKIYSVLDPVNKVLKVRISLPNPGYLLKPQMFASVKTEHPEKDSMLAIPAKDLVFDHSRYYVLVYHGKSGISIQPVKIWQSDGPLTFISEGLSSGDILVGSQTLLIYQALND